MKRRAFLLFIRKKHNYLSRKYIDHAHHLIAIMRRNKDIVKNDKVIYVCDHIIKGIRSIAAINNNGHKYGYDTNHNVFYLLLDNLHYEEVFNYLKNLDIDYLYSFDNFIVHYFDDLFNTSLKNKHYFIEIVIPLIKQIHFAYSCSSYRFDEVISILIKDKDNDHTELLTTMLAQLQEDFNNEYEPVKASEVNQEHGYERECLNYQKAIQKIKNFLKPKSNGKAVRANI